MAEASEQLSPEPRILFAISVPDSVSAGTTPFQGFAPSLCRHAELIQLLALMPSDIFELKVADMDVRIARRIAGEAPVWWAPLMPSVIMEMEFDAAVPFAFILVSPDDDVGPYMRWKARCEAPPLIIAREGGDTTFENLTPETVQKHCALVAKLVSNRWPAPVRKQVLDLTEDWVPPARRTLGYSIGGHNAFTPNLLALRVAGFDKVSTEAFAARGFGIQPYVDEIVRTSNSIFDERDRIGDRDAFRMSPPPPDLTFFAPSIYAHFRKSPTKLRGDRLTREVAGLISALNRQRGYRFEMSPERMAEAGIRITSHGVNVGTPLRIRISELELCTNAAAVMATSEFSSVVRLPNDINRMAGHVRQFAAHQRGKDASDRKRLRVFSNIQTELARAIPHEFLSLIRRSKTGIRIVSDAPIEWLDIDGVPLGLAFDTTHLPTTPGNFLISQLIAHKRIYLKPEVFGRILILNALESGDPIQPFFTQALAVYDPIFRDKTIISSVEVGSTKDFVDAIGGFPGAFVIFNGHGSHAPGEPGYLWLKREKVDVWQLKRDLSRVPPIVFLSACDTYAADRNHATTAAGFLALGARAVIGSYFPLLALEATLFAARLIHRVLEYIPAAIEYLDRAVTWSEIVSGMLRMTLLRDYLWRLHLGQHLDGATYERLHTKGNSWINTRDSEPWAQKIQSAVAETGVPIEQARSEFRYAVSSSSAISYVHLGRPETILFDTEARIKAQIDTWKTLSQVTNSSVSE